ncbi:MAG: NifU family protein [Deferribacteres bacterium]|nr:NifU family protein [Deferribacteres bacterium]
MSGIEKLVTDVLNDLNWLIEPHDSFVELIEVKGNRVVIRCVGHCAGCESDCIRVAFRERIPDIELVVK